MKRNLIGISLLLSMVLLISSCIKDNFDLDTLSTEMELTPDLVLPLIYGAFDMDDLVEVLDTGDYSLEDGDGTRYYLVFPDTIYSLDETVDFSSDFNEDVVDYLQIKVNTVNEMAIRMVLQIYLEDENHEVLGTFFDNEGVLLDPAQIDDDGKLLEAAVDENSSTLEEEFLSILNEAAYMRVRTGMYAPSSGMDFVKIYASYALSFDISMEVHAKINTGDLN